MKSVRADLQKISMGFGYCGCAWEGRIDKRSARRGPCNSRLRSYTIRLREPSAAPFIVAVISNLTSVIASRRLTASVGPSAVPFGIAEISQS